MREEVISVDILLQDADEATEDLIEGTLWESGIQGFERQDEDTFSHLVDEPYPLPRGATRWRVNVAAETTVEGAVDRFREALQDFPQLEITAWMRDITGYRTIWMQYFNPTRVSERIMIHPPWDKPESDADVMVEIDPGMAFGTGTHESTRLMLMLMDRLGVPKDGLVLDVGMGSGILAIAAIKLGAAKAIGMDLDPDATREAIRNAGVNGVAEFCEFRTGELGDEDPQGDMVIANILPHILMAMSRTLIEHTKHGAPLLLSGILLIEEKRITRHFEEAGMKCFDREEMNDWVGLVFKHADALS